MKSDEYIRKEVYQEMTQNGTLTLFEGYYDIPDGMDYDDVREAFVNRYAQKINEELHEPYWSARINGNPTEIINNELERFVGLINNSCQEFDLHTIDEQQLLVLLREKLDKQFV